MVLQENRDLVEQRATEGKEANKENLVPQEGRAVLVKEEKLVLLE